MSEEWYYVDGKDRVGPISHTELESLFGKGTINKDSYVWKKGFDNWEHVRNVAELAGLKSASEAAADEIPSLGDIKPIHESPVDLKSIDNDKKVFTVKVGYDRGGSDTEYGPFSLTQLRLAYEENRINDKTFIFCPGMENWQLLGDFEVFDKISDSLPPQIDDSDRRIAVRKPFIARLLFHDNKDVYEGICRDISVGGLQILISDFPCKVGEVVSLNVHPDNSDYHFTASGIVVRKLDADSGFSLRFKDLSSEAYQAINQYVNEN